MKSTRSGVLLGLMLSVGFMATPARAQVSINVHIGAPPPVVMYSPPTMVLLPEPQMYVAVGVPYDIYFVNGQYFYFHADHWFSGPRYGGPWTYVAFEKLPPGLRKFKVKQLREFREREYRGYRAQGASFHGKYFVAEDSEHHGRGKDNDNDDRDDNGKGKGRGRGRP